MKKVGSKGVHSIRGLKFDLFSSFEQATGNQMSEVLQVNFGFAPFPLNTGRVRRPALHECRQVQVPGSPSRHIPSL